MARKQAAKVASDDEATPVTDRGLYINNTTREHVVALTLENGLVGLVPVTLRDEAHVSANFTEVTE